MSDDVKTLREAANDAEKFSEMVGSSAMHKAIAILCRRLADSIEREEANGCFAIIGPDGNGVANSTAPSTLSEAEDRGWNAAIRAIEEKIGNDENLAMHRDGLLRLALRALRRGAS